MLRLQSGQISEDDDHAEYAREEDDALKHQALKGHEDIPEATSHFPSPFHDINDESFSHDTGQPPVTLHIVKVENTNDVSFITLLIKVVNGNSFT